VCGGCLFSGNGYGMGGLFHLYDAVLAHPAMHCPRAGFAIAGFEFGFAGAASAGPNRYLLMGSDLATVQAAFNALKAVE
jgi:hypothetical protein